MDSPFLEMRRGEEEREVVILIMGNSRKLRWKFRRKIEIARCGFFSSSMIFIRFCANVRICGRVEGSFKSVAVNGEKKEEEEDHEIEGR